MYRLLKCTKDCYIANKYTNNTRSIDANVGQAGTLDLFKLYNESILANGTGSGIELSRLLVKFDLSPLQSLTSSILNTNTSSFKCFLSLKDVYGGQTVPSNFTISLFPLAKDWDEGRGSDIIAFRDIDSANYVTASVTNGLVTTWSQQGAGASGTLGASNLDVYVSGNLLDGNGVVLLEQSQSFARGDEDLLIDVTKLISGTLAGILPDYGFRLSFKPTQEQDGVTRFVKRFGSRHVKNVSLKPRLVVQYNDAIIDDHQALFFDVPNNLFHYNHYYGTSRNFFSGSSEITGSNSLILTLATSRSITSLTTSYQANFSASITHSITTTEYFSQSFSASQYAVGQNYFTGVYFSNFTLSPTTNATLSNFIGPSSSVKFQQFWQSADRTVTYLTGSTLTIRRILGSDSNVQERNFVLNVSNLKTDYTVEETARLRVFAQDLDTEIVANRIPQNAKPAVFKTMHYRLLDAFSRKVLIPFDTTYNSTLLSSDGKGMYFDMYMQDLEQNQVYELEFLIRENGRDYLINNQGFRFRVVV